MNHTIEPNCDIRGNITYGDGVVVQRGTWLNAPEGVIRLCSGVNVGRRSVISSYKLIIIEENVLIAPNVFITDVSHEYKDIKIPISQQGITEPREIRIGQGSWLGINSVIMANVGEHCIVGANSVLTKDLPDYCIAVGQPAKIIKRYNLITKQWEKIKQTRERNSIPKEGASPVVSHSKKTTLLSFVKRVWEGKRK